MFFDAITLCIPEISSYINSEKKVPWVTHVIKQAMRKPQSLFRKARRIGIPANYFLQAAQKLSVVFASSCCPLLEANCSVFQSVLEPSHFLEHLQCDPNFVADMLSTLDLSKFLLT